MLDYLYFVFYLIQRPILLPLHDYIFFDEQLPAHVALVEHNHLFEVIANLDTAKDDPGHDTEADKDNHHYQLVLCCKILTKASGGEEELEIYSRKTQTSWYLPVTITSTCQFWHGDISKVNNSHHIYDIYLVLKEEVIAVDKFSQQEQV